MGNCEKKTYDDDLRAGVPMSTCSRRSVSRFPSQPRCTGSSHRHSFEGEVKKLQLDDTHSECVYRKYFCRSPGALLAW